MYEQCGRHGDFSAVFHALKLCSLLLQMWCRGLRVCAYVRWAQQWVLQKRLNRLKYRLEQTFVGPMNNWTTRRCTMAPLAENDWRICTSAVMRSVATITVATCSTYLRLTVLLFYFYLVFGREAVYCYVQLWVCPSACLSFVCPLIYLRNHMSKLYQILKSMHITRGHGSVYL